MKVATPPRRALRFGPCLLLFCAAAAAQDLASFERRVTTRQLENGLTVLICERPGAPVFSFFTHVNAGGAQEVPGILGLAHLFEHMAFKGTDRIGTTDYAAEKAALARVEGAYAAYDAARRRPKPDTPEVARLEKAWKAAIDEAGRYVVKEEFSDIIERQGGQGVNAFTSNDETGYFYSLPSNRLELWAYLEAERFRNPVYREFYQERDVVLEERRMRVDSRPIGRLMDQFLAIAYIAHPYRSYGLEDVASVSATDAEAFFRKYYVPANMVVTLVGDVTAREALPLVEKYLGRLPKGPRPEPLRTVEPPQIAEKEVILWDPSQPFYIEGYHKPGALHPDDAVYDAIQDLLSEGRTSRLYRSLVRDKKVAANASGFNGFPGVKYPNLFAFFAVATPGHTNREIADAIHGEIERLKIEDASPAELQMVRTRARANLIRRLADNEGLAVELGTAQAIYGDWREIFRKVDRIEKVSAEDIRRAAQATFVANNRTVGRIETQKPEPAPTEAQP